MKLRIGGAFGTESFHVRQQRADVGHDNIYGIHTQRLHILCGLFLLAAGPEQWLRSVSELTIGLVLVPLVVVTLGWFVYSVFLRKPLRARHIRVLRERRELREAAARGQNDEH